MYFSKFLLPACLASMALANISVGGKQIPLAGLGNKNVDALDTNVPGKNPLEFCEEPDNYEVEITSVDLDPNPPEAGKTLDIVAKGKVSKTIEEGAYVNIVVKYGLIKILTLREDLCEQFKKVDIKCPVKEGEVVVKKSVDLPSRIPPGKYTVNADAATKDDEELTCLQATISFSI